MDLQTIDSILNENLNLFIGISKNSSILNKAKLKSLIYRCYSQQFGIVNNLELIEIPLYD